MKNKLIAQSKRCPPILFVILTGGLFGSSELLLVAKGEEEENKAQHIKDDFENARQEARARFFYGRGQFRRVRRSCGWCIRRGVSRSFGGRVSWRDSQWWKVGASTATIYTESIKQKGKQSKVGLGHGTSTSHKGKKCTYSSANS